MPGSRPRHRRHGPGRRHRSRRRRGRRRPRRPRRLERRAPRRCGLLQPRRHRPRPGRAGPRARGRRLPGGGHDHRPRHRRARGRTPRLSDLQRLHELHPFRRGFRDHPTLAGGQGHRALLLLRAGLLRHDASERLPDIDRRRRGRGRREARRHRLQGHGDGRRAQGRGQARRHRGAGGGFRRSRPEGPGGIRDDRGPRRRLRRIRRGCQPGRRGRRLAAPQRTGRPDGQGRLARALRGGRHLRSDPAPGGHEDLGHDRGDQQGRRRADLQGR